MKMYKGTITTQITDQATNVNIPFTTTWNTNNNTAYDSTNNAVRILQSGFYDVALTIVLTGITTNVSAQLYADGVAIPEAIATATVGATTDIVTLNIADTIRVLPTVLTSIADLSVRLSGTTTTADITSAVLTVEKRK